MALITTEIKASVRHLVDHLLGRNHKFSPVGEPKPKYLGWSHKEIIEHQREKIQDVIKGSSRSAKINLDIIRGLKTAEEIQAYIRRWCENEESDNGDNDYLRPFPVSLAFLYSFSTLLDWTGSPHASVVGGGSSVNLDTTANQSAQQTLRSIPQPRRHYEKNELVVEWEIKEFVWWSEFLDKLPEAYLKLLDLLNIDKADYYAEYRGFYHYRHAVQNPNCPLDSIYVPVVNCGRYHPYASVKHRRRASVRALDRFEFLEEECRKRRVKFDYLITIDLTLPKAVSEKWADSNVQCRIREAVKDFLRELHAELFPNKNSEFGVIKNPHYWATKSPLDPHRHVHLTIPNVCYNKNTDMFHRFRPSFDKDLIKKVWRKCLIANDLWFGVSENADPVIWTEYFKFENREKVLHRLSYCARKPIEDMVKFLTISDISEDFDIDFALFLLDYTPRRVNLGFLTNLKRFGYSRKPTPFRCPLCGCEMEPELNKVGDKRLYPRPPPEILHLFKDRRGDWRETVNLAVRLIQ